MTERNRQLEPENEGDTGGMADGFTENLRDGRTRLGRDFNQRLRELLSMSPDLTLPQQKLAPTATVEELLCEQLEPLVLQGDREKIELYLRTSSEMRRNLAGIGLSPERPPRNLEELQARQMAEMLRRREQQGRNDG